VKLAVFGATGGTGRSLVQQALAQGHAVTALVRDPERAALPTEVGVVAGDVRDAAPVGEVVAGVDAVLSCLGASLPASMGARGMVGTDGVPVIIEAMKRHGVRRLIAVSAFGAGDSKPQISLMFRNAMATMLRGIYKDKNGMEPVIQGSEVDWTILRPTNLTDGPRTGQVVFDPADKLGVRDRIARADVAEVMLRVLPDRAFHRRTTIITARPVT